MCVQALELAALRYFSAVHSNLMLKSLASIGRRPLLLAALACTGLCGTPPDLLLQIRFNLYIHSHFDQHLFRVLCEGALHWPFNTGRGTEQYRTGEYEGIVLTQARKCLPVHGPVNLLAPQSS